LGPPACREFFPANYQGIALNGIAASYRTSTIVTFGLVVRLQTSPGHLLPRMIDLLAAGWESSSCREADRTYSLIATSPAASGDCRFELRVDGAKLAETWDIDFALDCFETDLQIFVGDRCSTRVFVHAGVVAWRNRAILFPGSSYCGKSTLVAEFLRRGAGYYSDEFAVLDSAGLVEPYARRLSLRQTCGRPVRATGESLGGVADIGPAQARLIVLARFEAGARWNPRRLPAGLAVLEIVKHCLPVRRRPEAVLDTLARVASRACVLQGARGEAWATVDELIRGLDSIT
jgi:hypothetical protein